MNLSLKVYQVTKRPNKPPCFNCIYLCHASVFKPPSDHVIFCRLFDGEKVSSVGFGGSESLLVECAFFKDRKGSLIYRDLSRKF